MKTCPVPVRPPQPATSEILESNSPITVLSMPSPLRDHELRPPAAKLAVTRPALLPEGNHPVNEKSSPGEQVSRQQGRSYDLVRSSLVFP